MSLENSATFPRPDIEVTVLKSEIKYIIMTN